MNFKKYFLPFLITFSIAFNIAPPTIAPMSNAKAIPIIVKTLGEMAIEGIAIAIALNQRAPREQAQDAPQRQAQETQQQPSPMPGGTEPPEDPDKEREHKRPRSTCPETDKKLERICEDMEPFKDKRKGPADVYEKPGSTANEGPTRFDNANLRNIEIKAHPGLKAGEFGVQDESYWFFT